MSSRSSPFQDSRLRAALGCKVKAQSASRALSIRAKSPLTLRDHSPVSFLDRKAGLAHGKALLRKRYACPVSDIFRK
jgi:hypothetical protein